MHVLGVIWALFILKIEKKKIFAEITFTLRRTEDTKVTCRREIALREIKYTW